MAKYHNPETGKTVEAPNAKEAFKPAKKATVKPKAKAAKNDSK